LLSIDAQIGSRLPDESLLVNELQISRNNLKFHSYSRLRVFGREFLMTMKMVIFPLTFASLAVLLVYTEHNIPCVVMVLAKFAARVSL
jgi:hypothetical protein